MTRVVTETINPTLPEEQQIIIPAHLVDKTWEKTKRAEYEQAVKLKKLEIQNL